MTDNEQLANLDALVSTMDSFDHDSLRMTAEAAAKDKDTRWLLSEVWSLAWFVGLRAASTGAEYVNPYSSKLVRKTAGLP